MRKFRQFLVGLLAATVVIVFWPHVGSAQIIQPSLCANEIVAPQIGNGNFPVYEVIAELGVARTGPHDDCKRGTPLPRGTRARVVATGTGPNRFKENVPWSRLDYGAWILSSELQPVNVVPVLSQLSEVSTRNLFETTELVFAMSSAVPIRVEQGDRTFSLTFHNANGQIINLTEGSQRKNWSVNSLVKFTNPVVDRASWQKTSATDVRFNFQLKPKQQWGYQMRYEGNNFVLSLRHSPKLAYTIGKPLRNLRIVLDPGHGSDPPGPGAKKESGAVGKTAAGVEYQEKDLNLQVSQLLERELQERGAIVTMTRNRDMFLSLDDRQVIINRVAPVLSLSIHHDATIPGRGSVGASSYWYHPQSRNLAASLLSYYARYGNRPILNNDGVLQKPFAVARPSSAPAILFEMGFMSNPQELGELAQPETQQRLAKVLADGIVQWVVNQTSP